ncbi:hypothetical protein ACFFX0_26955 [Citricoccus parietis]|uniref:Uncharacterized protein n=1 Tax=Citricoccus parietis TaxID=592307 RepID=A0ABV5G6Q8_9MICC
MSSAAKGSEGSSQARRRPASSPAFREADRAALAQPSRWIRSPRVLMTVLVLIGSTPRSGASCGTPVPAGTGRRPGGSGTSRGRLGRGSVRHGAGCDHARSGFAAWGSARVRAVGRTPESSRRWRPPRVRAIPRFPGPTGPSPSGTPPRPRGGCRLPPRTAC